MPSQTETYDSLAELRSHLSHQRLRLVFDHWISIRGNLLSPRRRDLDEASIVSALPYVYINQFIASIDDYRVRLLGTAYYDFYGSDVTGKLMSEIFRPSIWRELKAQHDRVRRSCMPSYCEILAPNRYGNQVLYQRLLMPLSDDDGVVDRLFGVGVFERPDYRQVETPFTKLSERHAELTYHNVEFA